MLRFKFLIILTLVFLPALPLNAQQKRSPYGPVVTAYLTGLNEELNELAFQLRQREISRADYERARQRLLILRRLVQERVRQNRADTVPELQVLQLDEFGMVGLSQPPEPERLQPGNVFDESWRLFGIEKNDKDKTKPAFYVFEKVATAPTKTRERLVERQAQHKFDPLEVIETIVVPDPPSAQPMATRPRSASSSNEDLPQPEPQAGNAVAGPRILGFYLPEYTEKARDKAVEGDLIVSALFRRDGKVRDVVIMKSLGFGLDERVVEAVKRISFEPARLGERSIDARAELVFNFKLSKVNARLRNVTAE
jgi:TonB family protein